MTSMYIGSPTHPGSLVRSMTAIALVVGGKAAKKASAANGRYIRTLRTPTFSSRSVSHSTIS